MEALLAAGCDAAVVDSQGATALMKAAGAGHTALLPRLLAAGVPLEARDQLGLTALLTEALQRRAGGVSRSVAGPGL